MALHTTPKGALFGGDDTREKAIRKTLGKLFVRSSGSSFFVFIMTGNI